MKKSKITKKNKTPGWFVKIIDRLTIMHIIALTITLAVIGMTVTIGIVALHDPANAKKEGFDFVAKTLLPLWGTWIGTILAFYFGKQQLDAATQSNRDLLGKLSENEQKFASQSVTEVMTPIEDIETLNLVNDGDRLVTAIYTDPKFKDFNRFPIFSSSENTTLEYLVHRLVIVSYLYKLSEEEKSEKTLNDLLIGNMEVQMKLKDSVGFVSEKATLLDAKNEMDKLQNCEDVFVTKTGKNSEEVLGWITDKDIYKYGKV